MAVFFLMGLERKREIVIGTLTGSLVS